MSIEPTCHYCGASDKNRCRTYEETKKCPFPADSVCLADDYSQMYLRKAQPEPDNIKISVYMNFGSVYTYYVHPDKAREHVSAIIQTGYRHTPKGSDDLEWFPPHRILKVVVENGGKNTNYKQDVRAT